MTPIQAAHALRLMLNRTGAAALRVVPQQAAFAIRMLLTRLALQEAS